MGAYVSEGALYVCPRRKQKADEDEGAVKERNSPLLLRCITSESPTPHPTPPRVAVEDEHTRVYDVASNHFYTSQRPHG